MSTMKTQIDLAEKRWKRTNRKRATIKAEIKKMRRGEKADLSVIDDPKRYRKRFERLDDMEAAEAVVVGAAAEFNPLERILGQSQLAGVEFFERGMVAARAVARVRIRAASGLDAGFGSGIMISPRLFMTNNHVVGSKESAANSLAEFGYLTSAGGPRDPLPFRFLPEEFFQTDVDLDFTIVAVEPVNAAGDELIRRGWAPLIAESGKAIVGERTNIIQHPSGERMQVAVRDNEIVNIVDDFLHYVADTQPGSSGSPVFNDQWEMAALHHSGVPKRNAAGDILLRNGQPWSGTNADLHRIDWEANEGIRISSIVAHMNGLDLTPAETALWERVFVPGEPLDIWDLMDRIDDGGVQEATPVSGVISATPGAAGTASWLFRLTVEPVGDTAVTRLHPVSPAQPETDGEAGARDMAQTVFDRFRHDDVYYDKAEDTHAADTYWDGIDWARKAATLFPALNERITSTHTSVPYSRARLEFLYPAIDMHKDDKLRNIYSGVPFDPVEAIASELAPAIAKTQARGQEVSIGSLETLLVQESLWDEIEEEAARVPFNCEHVVPQSWFQKHQPMRGDLHHLFACEHRCNSFRGNTPYWQFPPEHEAVMEECGRREESKFEPAHGKGAVARATMYFLMRYPGEADELPKQRVSVLLDWHKAHPVDDYERHRNWLIHKAQGNRNPFIDRPEEATKALLSFGFDPLIG